MNEISLGNARKFSYASLRIATNNFSGDTFIGEGGFARVYRGVLPNGTQIAVKNYRNVLQHSPPWLEAILGIQHPNINQVVGYCIHENHRLLVLEYEGNGNLYDLLHSPEKRGSVFNWPMRVAVCIGIARGLSYLHEDANPHIIHRDIKTSNILLGSNFTPKITDFDLVKLFSNSTELPLEEDVVAGTLKPLIGYLRTYKCTEKSDVYGFGVVMLEIITGRKAIFTTNDGTRQSLVLWALNLLRNDTVLEMIDPMLSDLPTDQVRRFIDVALSCTNKESKLRPSMREVIRMLTSLEMPTPDDTSYSTYISAASSFRSSTAETKVAEQSESSILEFERNMRSTEIEPADSDIEFQAQGESEGIETYDAREQREQDQDQVKQYNHFLRSTYTTATARNCTIGFRPPCRKIVSNYGV